MQKIHEFNLSIGEYAAKGADNDFPYPDHCPLCKAQIPLKPHGFYQRNAVVYLKVYRVKIRRYLCPDCSRTVSILPSFLLPNYQYSLEVIMECLEEYFAAKKDRLPFYRQLVEFYAKRFLRNIPAIISFFRDTGERLTLRGEKKEKAIKLLENIKAVTAFSQRYHMQFQRDFMAL